MPSMYSCNLHSFHGDEEELGTCCPPVVLAATVFMAATRRRVLSGGYPGTSFSSTTANQIPEKDKKNAREASGIAAAVTKQAAGKFS